MTVDERFVLSERASWTPAWGDAYLAHDRRLDRPVIVVIGSRGANTAVAAAERVRLVRDEALARIVAVGSTRNVASGDARSGDARGGDTESADADSPGGTLRPYAAIALPGGVPLSSVIPGRTVPMEVARAIVAAAARAVRAASARGLAHGSIDAGALSVGPGERVTLLGAGLGVALGGAEGARAAARADAASLGQLFATAITGTNEPAAWEARVPDDATGAERTLVARLAAGDSPASVADIERTLGPAGRLTRFSARWRLFPHAAELESATTDGGPDVDVAPAEEAAPAAIEAPAVDAPAVEDSVEPRPVDVGDTDELPPLDDLPALDDRPSRDELAVDDDAWGLDALDPELVDDRLPTLAEASLDFLHRRFPKSEQITRRLEEAHRRGLEGPRVDAQRWAILPLLGLVVVLSLVALAVFRAPFVPGYDLKNPPPQSYPDFTISPDAPEPDPSN